MNASEAGREDGAAVPFRTGAIAVLGRPNVGKSTLVNALVGQKVSITANKPQTTRHRVLGVANRPGAQLLLVDTPGLHAERKRALDRQLNRAARGAVEGIDATLLVVEAGRWSEADEVALEVAAQAGVPVVLAVNKIDRLKDKSRLLPYLGKVGPLHAFAAVVPISAEKGSGIDALVAELVRLLPERPAEYPEDEPTDRSERFLASELIREQVLRQLHQELPYSAAVVIERWEEGAGGERVEIGATILVERDAQKGIVVGAQGSRIKAIGTAARKGLIDLLGRPVRLELWCRVRSGWSDDEAAVARFGYGD